MRRSGRSGSQRDGAHNTRLRCTVPRHLPSAQGQRRTSQTLPDAALVQRIDSGHHVVLEGILYVAHYGRMLQRLVDDHRGHTHCYYLDVPFAETLRRHATKPQAAEYGEAELREWYRPRDLLPGGVETVLGAGSALTDTVERIVRESGLAGLPALEG
ncbi:hypothetical protein [Streptomyces sp. NBC_00827]|uniref:hypothetical protein n=1 Tax=Streptomyces sp. NBC_00827 TaxID=2903677 RepID=UPI00386F833A